MKKSNIHFGRYLFSFIFGITFSFLNISSVSALALCITNPETGPCGLSALVSASSTSVSLNTSTNLSFQVDGIFQNWNYLDTFDSWKIEDTTGVYTSPMHIGGIPVGHMYNRSRSGNSGVLSRGATITLHVTDTSLSEAYDSLYIGIDPSSCNLGCGGSVRFRTDATQMINDYSCNADQRLLVSGGSWSMASCSGIFTQNPGSGNMSCVVDPACVATVPTINLWFSP